MQHSNRGSREHNVPLLFILCGSPLIQKVFLLEQPRAFLFKLSSLAGNKGCQKVKDCPGKQVRTSYTHYQMKFSFRYCVEPSVSTQDLGVLNYPCDKKSVVLNSFCSGRQHYVLRQCK